MKHWVLILLGCLSCHLAWTQKTAYIPLYLLDTNTVDGKQFTWAKTAQSANFTVIWGDSAGVNPQQPNDPSLAFDPVSILDTMEYIYQIFKTNGFARDTIGTNLHQYKIPVVMLNTFGPAGATGWAFGGDVDGVIGAFWAHPLAMQGGHVAAHELVHSLQAQIVIDTRLPNGLGGAWDNAGIFWETHANFLRNSIYPQDVTTWGMDLYGMESWGQWKNTYENYHLLFGIEEEDGIAIINRMWREAYHNEYPIAAYQRLSNLSQQDLNDKLFRNARRMATLDFPSHHWGGHLRTNRADNLVYFLPTVQTLYTILQQDSADAQHYIAPDHIAPEEYGYNLIPLNPIQDSCAVIVKFKGHTDANPYAGWRYGFVTSLPNGEISRYSDIYAAEEAIIGFSLLPNESQMYLVVMGAPNAITTDPAHDTWMGYPKRYRFPYELTITGGYPEGHQDPALFRSHLKVNGHLHPNGGGWVANAATVSNSVYVAPHALVLGNSTLSGNVRIDHTAMVQDASISGNVIVKDNAFVLGGTLWDNAVIAGQAFVENDIVFGSALIDMRARVSNYRLHGNIHVGGDVIVYNATGDCDNGVYFRMTNYYQDNLLECDNRTASHPNNSDVNNTVTPFTSTQMDMPCDCNNYPGCLVLATAPGSGLGQPYSYPNPASNELSIDLQGRFAAGCDIRLYDLMGAEWMAAHTYDVKVCLDISALASGIYLLTLSDGHDIVSQKVHIRR